MNQQIEPVINVPVTVVPASQTIENFIKASYDSEFKEHQVSFNLMGDLNYYSSTVSDFTGLKDEIKDWYYFKLLNVELVVIPLNPFAQFTASLSNKTVSSANIVSATKTASFVTHNIGQFNLDAKVFELAIPQGASGMIKPAPTHAAPLQININYFSYNGDVTHESIVGTLLVKFVYEVAGARHTYSDGVMSIRNTKTSSQPPLPSSSSSSRVSKSPSV